MADTGIMLLLLLYRLTLKALAKEREREIIGSFESLWDEDLWEKHCCVAFWVLQLLEP